MCVPYFKGCHRGQLALWCPRDRREIQQHKSDPAKQLKSLVAECTKEKLTWQFVFSSLLEWKDIWGWRDGEVGIWTEYNSQLKKIMSTLVEWSLCSLPGHGKFSRKICWINKGQGTLCLSFLMVSLAFQSSELRLSFFFLLLTEIHLSQSMWISRWWPHSVDMSCFYWHFCGIWIPDFGKPTLRFKWCFMYCHTASHSHTGAWGLLLLVLRLQLSLGSAPGSEAPSAVYPPQKGEGEQYSSLSEFFFSLFISSLCALWMLLLHEVPSSISF